MSSNESRYLYLLRKGEKERKVEGNKEEEGKKEVLPSKEVEMSLLFMDINYLWHARDLW